MTTFHLTGDALWERMERAVEKVRERLEKATSALEQAAIPFAIVGGNAVRAWVAQIDETAVRTTQDVDILLRRVDLPSAIQALEHVGFYYRHSAGIDMFLETPDAKARDAVHIVFAGEKVRDTHLCSAPDVDDAQIVDRHRTINLEPLARMKLTSFRDKDRMHLRDLLEVGLLDQSWCQRFPPELGQRLQELIDNPDG